MCKTQKPIRRFCLDVGAIRACGRCGCRRNDGLGDRAGALKRRGVCKAFQSPHAFSAAFRPATRRRSSCARATRRPLYSRAATRRFVDVPNDFSPAMIKLRLSIFAVRPHSKMFAISRLQPNGKPSDLPRSQSRPTLHTRSSAPICLSSRSSRIWRRSARCLPRLSAARAATNGNSSSRATRQRSESPSSASV